MEPPSASVRVVRFSTEGTSLIARDEQGRELYHRPSPVDWTALPGGDVIVVEPDASKQLQLKRIRPDGRARFEVPSPVEGAERCDLQAAGPYLVVLGHRKERPSAVVTLDLGTGALLSQPFELAKGGAMVVASNGMVYASNPARGAVEVIHPMGGVVATVPVSTPPADSLAERGGVTLLLQPDDRVLAITADGGIFSIDPRGELRGYSAIPEAVTDVVSRQEGGVWAVGHWAVYGLDTQGEVKTTWRVPRGVIHSISQEKDDVVVENNLGDVYKVGAPTQLTFESSNAELRFERVKEWPRDTMASLVTSGDRLYAVRSVEMFDEVDLTSVPQTAPLTTKVTTHEVQFKLDAYRYISPTALFFDDGLKVVAGAGYWSLGDPSQLGDVEVFDLGAHPKRLDALMPKHARRVGGMQPEWATAADDYALYICAADICYEHTNGREYDPPQPPATNIFSAPDEIVALQARDNQTLLGATASGVYERTYGYWSSLDYPGPPSIGRLAAGSAVWALTGFHSVSDSVELQPTEDQHLYRRRDGEWSVVETPTPEITTLFDDGQKALWVGSTSGLSRFDGENWQHIDGVGAQVSSILSVRGQMWVAAEDGLYLGVPISSSLPARDRTINGAVEPAVIARAAKPISLAPASSRLVAIGDVPVRGSTPEQYAFAVASDGSTLYLADQRRVIAWPSKGAATELGRADALEKWPVRLGGALLGMSDSGVMMGDSAVRFLTGKGEHAALGAPRALGSAPGGAIWLASLPIADNATIHAIDGGARAHHVDAPPFLYTSIAALSANDAWLAGGVASFGYGAMDPAYDMPIGAGALVHYDGSRYKTWRFREGALLAVTALSNGEVWAVGVGGLVVRVHGGEVETGVLPNAPTLRAVTEQGGEVWIAGDYDTLLVGRDLSSLARVDTGAAGVRSAFTGVARRGGDTFVVGPAGLFKVVR
ncbi:MAG: hypothetical protein U0271_13690 [Polyangiaceae bacterium]